MGYTDVSVIVGGALDEERTFDDKEDDELEVYLARLKTEDFGDEIAEVFLMHHDHDSDVEDCQCVQFLTDHRPYWSNES